MIILFFVLIELSSGQIPTTSYMEERMAMLYNNRTAKICVGSFISEDLILTCSSCLGEYRLIKDEENMSLYKFTPYRLKRLSIILFHGLPVEPLKLHIHDFFSMAIFEMDLYKYDLGIVKVIPKSAYFFPIPKKLHFHSESGVCSFFYMTKAEKMRKHSLTPWVDEARNCDFALICSDDRVCSMDFFFTMEKDGLRCLRARIPNVDPDVVGSPIICDGIIQGVVTKFVDYDVYFTALYHDSNHEFIIDVINLYS